MHGCLGFNADIEIEGPRVGKRIGSFQFDSFAQMHAMVTRKWCLLNNLSARKPRGSGTIGGNNAEKNIKQLEVDQNSGRNFEWSSYICTNIYTFSYLLAPVGGYIPVTEHSLIGLDIFPAVPVNPGRCRPCLLSDLIKDYTNRVNTIMKSVMDGSE